MQKIFEMSPHLADLIAAGEVVERPASVVKELVENSIDAGARAVTVEIRSGGMAEIRVTDDGSGIASEDVETAFLRHATSKLRTERDLEAIGTLGFRGEALAAISSVSRVELVTCEQGAREGTRLLLEGGVKTLKEPAGHPAGTTICVRDLFFNTPARQKFMKNDRAEGSAVTTAVVRLALSHPEISIKYIREGKEEYHTPGDGRLQSAAYCTLGREFARGLLPAENKVDGMTVTGYVSTPATARGNRSWQFFFINGRFIKSKLLQAAVEQAYRNSLFTGRFPVCLIDVDMGKAAVDVNVHPTKMEVRFADERAVFDAVYWAVRGALEREDKPKELELSRSTENALRSPVQAKDLPGHQVFAPQEGKKPPTQGGFLVGRANVKTGDEFYKRVSADTYRTQYGVPNSFKTAIRPSEVGPQGSAKKSEAELEDIAGAEKLVTLEDSVQLYDPVSETPEPDFAPETGPQTVLPLPEPEPRADTPLQSELTGRDWRYVGEALATYIIVERGDSIFLIDKHAAHERILFDRLKEQKYEVTSQVLLSPVVCGLDSETAGALFESETILSELGFELSDFGGGSVALRQVPIDMDLSDPVGLLEEIAGKLRAGGRQDVEAMRDGILHTVACKAAIKAGKRSEPAELTGLIEKVLSGAVRYCPHGRPVSLELTKTQLDRSFKRA